MSTRTTGDGTTRTPGVHATLTRMAEAERAPPASIARKVAVGGGLAMVAAITLFFAGFLWFSFAVAFWTAPKAPVADGILALTGGRDRVLGAVELLEAGRAKRLLISGVHPQTTATDILRATEADRHLFDCCVDLGRTAETTVGNAREAADWMHVNRFSSLIVVTSAYHMPRSLVELRRALPEVRMVPYPVARPDLNLRTWFLHPATARVLFQEYVKYVITRFGPVVPGLKPLSFAARGEEAGHPVRVRSGGAGPVVIVR